MWNERGLKRGTPKFIQKRKGFGGRRRYENFFCSLNCLVSHPGPHSQCVSEVGPSEPNSLDSEVSSVERALAVESEVLSLIKYHLCDPRKEE